MEAISTCTNPLCSCDPCTCGDCKCGAARLGELEQRVMDMIWEANGSELTGRDIADAAPEYAYTTIATVLDRLVSKGLLERRMVNRTNRYSPIGTGAAHAAAMMHKMLEATHDPAGALSRFAETLSGSEAAALMGALKTSDESTMRRWRKGG